jgi:hypothetical protein
VREWHVGERGDRVGWEGSRDGGGAQGHGESPCGGARDSNANFVVSVPARRNDGWAAVANKGAG